MLARLDADVLAAQPDLVLWQVGTNALLRDRDLLADEATIHEGLERIKASGADVILMDPQYSPEVIAKPENGHLVGLIASMAKDDDVGLFRRYAIMQNWREASGLPFKTFTSPDHLHMNDWGYGCVAKILAGAIADLAPRPIIAAKALAR
jgi:acyl-CoA thioesterase I